MGGAPSESRTVDLIGVDISSPGNPDDLLVVDDAPANLELLVAVLAQAGFSVRSAPDGKMALAAVRERLPALILLDVRLPDMDGYEVCRRLKADESTRSVPILFISALENDANRLQGFEAGGVDFITKPFRWAEVLARVRTHVELRRTHLILAHRNAELVQAYAALEADIVVRKKGEEALRKSEDRFFRVFHSSPVAIAITTLDEHRFIEVNESFERIFGYRREDAVGRTTLELGIFDDQEPVRDISQLLNDTGMARDIECRFRGKDGRLVIGLFSAERIELDDRSCAVSAVVDITEKKLEQENKARIQERLVRLQRLESVGTLAGGVAHEINNPLSVILNYAELVAAEIPGNVNVAQMTRQIVVHGERIATIVQNLLAFAQQERQARRAVPVGDIVRSALNLLRVGLEEDGILITTSLPEDLPSVLCRRQQIQQVLVNLLTNARDALNERYPGPDTNKILVAQATRVAGNGNGTVRITIENHGSDIPPTVLKRLFEPFFTTKQRGIGTGLGLFVSHGIVAEHHGTLTVETQPGQYTRFIVDLPVDDRDPMGAQRDLDEDDTE